MPDNVNVEPRKLILIRHAESQPLQGQHPSAWRLTTIGQARCIELAVHLKEFNPCRIYTSIERKAQETASLVARQLDIEVETYPDVHEHVRNAHTFLPPQQFRKTLQTFFEKPETLVFGSETAAAALARFSSAIETLLERDTDRHVAVVTHGTVISLFAGARSDWEPFPFWMRLGQPAIVIFDVASGTLARTVFSV